MILKVEREISVFNGKELMMSTTLNETPYANRVHIGFFGKTNSGKSSLINAFTKQPVSIVSKVAGTTTDPVYKAMEIHGIGPCVLIDTAGFDDCGELGTIRVEKTKLAAERTDLAVLVFSDGDYAEELMWFRLLREKKTPVICVLSKVDLNKRKESVKQAIQAELGQELIEVSAVTNEGMEQLKEELIRCIPEEFEMESITGNLVKPGDVVLLVMPQDIQAPKGRLILPQVQTIRDLLDQKCQVLSVTTDQLVSALSLLKKEPDLIITDSQVFGYVYEKKPKSSKLTSFSMLFAAYKGDIAYYLDSVQAILKLTKDSKVLIAECCTHAPLAEDIGREKIPKLLRKKVGEELQVDVCGGAVLPNHLEQYDLIIQCGACMFNRKTVLSRIERAKKANVPMTNYGVILAYLTGILDKVVV